MILKVFTKRTKGGELIETGLEWKDGLYEGEAIKRKPSEKGFDFLVVGKETDMTVIISTSISGYEILNDQGVVVEKYVTPVQPLEKNKIYKEGIHDVIVSGFSEDEQVEALRNEQEEETGKPKRGIIDDAEIIDDVLLSWTINRAKKEKLEPPYELVISTHRAMSPEWLSHVTKTFFPDIVRVTRENLPEDQFLLRTFES